ncbi:nose resistant to fluoxetine protein 6-like [Melitaea cinxia]|uniref:nose resistant to fluoxetine protein 6-like n=1 Tax=Melitaea cinxia TaxID=113334 RepID=UPI001E27021E|nr:nose resistant to fluoxetine protein 6-like [Melitaea cinxia]
MCQIIFVFILLLVTTKATVYNELEFTSAFDNELYERVIDDQKCEEQLEYLARNFSVTLEFIDSSGKIPNGILLGNLADFGNYHQCLGIDHLTDDLHIEGKYCMIRVPLNLGIGSIAPSRFSNVDDNYYASVFDEKMIAKLNHLNRVKNQADLMLNGKTLSSSRSSTPALALTLGVCVPKVCRSTQVFNVLYNSSFAISEQYCRLPNDKPMSAADYVAIAIFSVILLITIISTSYTGYQVFVLKKEYSELNPFYSLFSVQTNSKMLFYTKNPTGTIECMDGIRAISMFWVVVGHTYFLSNHLYLTNGIAALQWFRLFTSVWVNSAPLAVDTFLTLSGLLCVYTVIGKINQRQFLKTLHLFYLNRLLRMFPLLAAVILLQASFIHRLSDGPVWTNVATATEQCRIRWWAALLHVQNYIRPLIICLGPTWYLSVDIQLYVVSPLILLWLFGSKIFAWCSLVAAVFISLGVTSAYCFIYNFRGSVINPFRANEENYLADFYVNTLTRAAPFFIGMVFGYLMQQLKEKTLQLKQSFIAAAWALAFAFMAFCIFSVYPVLQVDYDNQTFDNILNSYMRSIWALALGWLIFACHRGYGGPINWFLSHQIWKVPARISYAMFLIHYPIIMVANGSMTSPYYFTDGHTIYRAMSDVMFTFGAALVLCIIIDIPFSILLKFLIGKGKKSNRKPKSESQTIIVKITENEEKVN